MTQAKETTPRMLGFMPAPDGMVSTMFNKWGYDTTCKLEHLKDADFAVFTGGEDVTPFLYGHDKHPTTHTNLRRDMRENRIYRMLDPLVPKFGICRGAQFLNVMNGGTLFQDVNNHTASHLMRLFFDEKMQEVKGERTLIVTSTHHQMMIPSRTGDPTIIGMADRATERWLGNTKFDVEVGKGKYHDTEIVFYENSNTLCFQPHPEYCEHETHPCRALFRNLFLNIMASVYGEQAA